MKDKFTLIFLVFAILHFSIATELHALIYQDISFASSPNPVGSGARAVGMGSAFIAVADDATAASWNPAGLIQLERPEISLVGDYVSRSYDFFSSTHPERDSKAETDDSKINYFSATYPFNIFNRNMVVSINYQRLYDFNVDFNYRYEASVPSPPFGSIVTSENREYSQEGYLGAIALAYATQITPKFSFGMTLNIWTGDLWWENGWNEKFRRHGTSTNTFFGATTTTDTVALEEYDDFSGENANFGILWNMNRYLTIGAVLKTPFTATLDRTRSDEQVVRNQAGVVIGGSSSAPSSERVKLRMPMSYGLGVACRFSDKFTVDFDAYRTEWSDFILTDGHGNKSSAIDGRPKDQTDIRDTTQLRLGAEYLFIFSERNLVVPIRAGCFYDPEPLQKDVRDFYGVSFGSGIGYKNFIFDIAYQFRWGRNEDTGNLVPSSNADVDQHSVLTSFIIHF